jgi:hypothetical protein
MRTSWILVGLLVVPVGAWAAEKHETALSIDQVPAAVKSAIEKELDGGQLGEIEKETEGGRTFYEARLTKDGHATYVHVAENGKVLKRESAAQERRGEPHEAAH